MGSPGRVTGGRQGGSLEAGLGLWSQLLLGLREARRGQGMTLQVLQCGLCLQGVSWGL